MQDGRHTVGDEWWNSLQNLFLATLGVMQGGRHADTARWVSCKVVVTQAERHGCHARWSSRRLSDMGVIQGGRRAG